MRQFLEEASFGGRRPVNLVAHLAGSLVAALLSRWILSTMESPFHSHDWRSQVSRDWREAPPTNPSAGGGVSSSSWESRVAQPPSQPTRTAPSGRMHRSNPVQPTESIRPMDIPGRMSRSERVVEPEPMSFDSEGPANNRSPYGSEIPSTQRQNHMGTWESDSFTEPNVGVRDAVNEANHPGSFPQEASPGWIQRITKPVGGGLQRITRPTNEGLIKRTTKPQGKSITPVELMWAKGLEG